MRTKLVLGAVMLAAGLASSMAQVYSLNVVGYVNVTLPGNSYYCVANPLDASMGGTVANGNDLTNLFTATTATPLNASSFVSIFDPTTQNYSTTIPTYSGRSGTWSDNFHMPPGVGALFYNNGGDTVVTFVGQVIQGTNTVTTLAPNAFTMVGSPVPIGGDVTNSTTVVGLVPGASDTVATFDNTAQNWISPVTWSARSGTWSGAPLSIAPGQGFLYYNNNAANTWVSNFTVQ